MEFANFIRGCGIINLNKVITDENLGIMQCLSPLSPRRRHQDVDTDRLDCVRNSHLERNEFGEWRHGENGAIRMPCFATGIREWERHF